MALCVACNAIVGMHFILVHIRSFVCFLITQENVSVHRKACQVQHDEGPGKRWIFAVSVVEARATEQKGPGHRAQAAWPEKSSRDAAALPE